MNHYCVVISGLQAGAVGSAAWTPVAAALKMDDVAFAQRVVAALPLIVRQHMDQTAAEDLVKQLLAMQIDARVLPDDEQLAYLHRGGTPRGPLPLSSLDTFIQVGEGYRLHGHTEWRDWAAPPSGSEFPPPAPADPNGYETPPPLPDMSCAPPLESPATLLSSNAELPQRAVPRDDLPPPLPPAGYAVPIPPLESSTIAIPPPVKTVSTKAHKQGGDAGMRLLLPVGRSGLAIAAGYLGLLSIIPVIAPITLIVSILAWRDLRRHPDKHGFGRTIFGLVMGGGITLAMAIAWPISVYQSHWKTTSTPVTITHSAPEQRSPAQPPPETPLVHTTSATAAIAVAPAVLTSAPPIATANAASSATGHCDVDAPRARTPEEVTLLANGQRHLTGRAVRAGASGEIYVVEAALGYDGMCRPSPYQIYVFNHGKLAGTLSVDAMHARSDGAITDFKLADPNHLQIQIAHYQPSDPACCASSHETRLIALSQFGMDSFAAAPTPSPEEDQGPHVQAPNGPSFDCAKARSVTDVMICVDGTLSRLDLEQAQLYRQAMAEASPDDAQMLKRSQRQWLRNRARLCAADKSCIERQFNARIATLKKKYPLPAVPPYSEP